MGIVVTLAQLLGLMAYFFLYVSSRKSSAANEPARSLTLFKNRVAVPALAALGVWNVVWYGMRHIDTFWGQAAVISGVVMLLAALDLTGRRVLLARVFVVIALLATCSLYGVTLIRLNLGLSIIN